MDITVSVLASSSRANSTLISCGDEALLIDAGLSCRETLRRCALAQPGLDPAAAIRAICLTHEHVDHIAGIRVLQKRLAVPIYGTYDTAQHADRDGHLDWRFVQPSSPFDVGPFHVTAFRVPHDAHDPVGYRIECGGRTIAIATDLGMPTTTVRQYLANADILVLESNHEPSILRSSGRSPELIRRILSNQGHLSNDVCAGLLAELCEIRPPLHVLLAHLSSECNDRRTALYTATRRLAQQGFSSVHVQLTSPDEPVSVSLPLLRLC